MQHVLVTEYGPGAAIGWHRDKAVFGEVVGISLLAACTFRLLRAGDSGWERVSLAAAPRSVTRSASTTSVTSLRPTHHSSGPGHLVRVIRTIFCRERWWCIIDPLPQTPDCLPAVSRCPRRLPAWNSSEPNRVTLIRRLRSSKTRRNLCAVLLAALVLTGCDRASRESSGSAEQPVEIVLKADSAVSFPHPFTTVAGLRELDGGRVLVSDRSETRVVLADFGTGDTVRVGSEGAGPGEYAIPGKLVALPGDSTLLVDEGGQRFAVIHADGRIGSTLNPPSGVLVTRLGAVGPAGDLYFEGTPGAAASTGAGSPDSVPVLRWTRGDVRVDTVAHLRVPPLVSASFGDPAAGAVSRIAFPQPFAPGDGWGVSPEGEMLILRAEPFRMERRGRDGTQAGTGPSLRRPPVAVTERDREGFALGRAAAESIQWPATKPPFRYGTLRIAPAGEAWIELSTAGDDPAPLYGILRPDGTLVRMIRLPEGRRLVGLGRTSLYAVRKDDDGLEWVERYAL